MISIRGLRKRLGTRNVLDGVDLDINTGESVVVLGPSGTGKSVLLKHIIGLMRPDAGSIEIDGEQLVGLRESEMNVIRRRFVTERFHRAGGPTLTEASHAVGVVEEFR